MDENETIPFNDARTSSKVIVYVCVLVLRVTNIDLRRYAHWFDYHLDRFVLVAYCGKLKTNWCEPCGVVLCLLCVRFEGCVCVRITSICTMQTTSSFR